MSCDSIAGVMELAAAKIDIAAGTINLDAMKRVCGMKDEEDDGESEENVWDCLSMIFRKM
jgi:hypothetical protein